MRIYIYIEIPISNKIKTLSVEYNKTPALSYQTLSLRNSFRD